VSNSPKIYRVGTLTYTKPGLVVLFGWLLWGDFMLYLMESVNQGLLPILLKSHNATNAQIAIITSTIFMVLNAVMNPVISYKSDRYRGRWGRRRPFIMFTTPVAALLLAAIPFAPDFIQSAGGLSWLAGLMEKSPVAPVLIMFGVLVAAFQIFNLFMASVYYYLIPDVVPNECLGQFYGLFRVFGIAAVAIYNYFLLGKAGIFMREIFVGVAIVYGVSIMVMCWCVKEGEYPPPAAEESKGHWWSGIRNYAKECFGSSYFWWVFLGYSCVIWSNLSQVFFVFFGRDELGLSLERIGHITAFTNIAIIFLLYPYGLLLDRWGSHKTFLVTYAVTSGATLLMLFLTHGPTSFTVLTAIRWIPMQIIFVASMKWTVDVYPRERYGQFGSAGALFASAGSILLAPVCGMIMDWVGSYRFLFVWQAFFTVLGTAAVIIVYRHSQRPKTTLSTAA
jgi:MFS family permease